MALALTLALSGVARAAPPAIDPASLTGRLIFIGRDEGRHLPHPIAVRAYSLKLGTKMPTEIPLTPLDREVWFLARNPAAGDVYYFTSDGVKDNAWYLLKSFDGITDTLDPPHSVSIARYVQSFAVSPDGRYIAGVHKMSGVFHLWIDDLSGTTPSVEIRGQDTWPYHPPIWSPDGKHLIFVGSLGGDLNYSELFGVDPDGSHLRQLTDLPQWVSWWVRLWADPVRHNPRWDLHKSAQPRWSPDGQWVIFSSFKGVYRMRPDGSDLQLVVPDAWSPAWSPDGNMIVYAARRSNGGWFAHQDGPVLFHLFVSYPDGSGETQLTDDKTPIAYSDLYWLK